MRFFFGASSSDSSESLSEEELELPESLDFLSFLPLSLSDELESSELEEESAFLAAGASPLSLESSLDELSEPSESELDEESAFLAAGAFSSLSLSEEEESDELESLPLAGASESEELESSEEESESSEDELLFEEGEDGADSCRFSVVG